jgi:hypothetical protein
MARLPVIEGSAGAFDFLQDIAGLAVEMHVTVPPGNAGFLAMAIPANLLGICHIFPSCLAIKLTDEIDT